MTWTRRRFLASAISAPVLAQAKPQRVVVFMIDGLGVDYWQKSDLPHLHAWAKTGIFSQVSDVMPSVTNANNTSICCGCYPETHGITGNTYLDTATGSSWSGRCARVGWSWDRTRP